MIVQIKDVDLLRKLDEEKRERLDNEIQKSIILCKEIVNNPNVDTICL